MRKYVELLIDMLKFYTPSRREEKLSHYIAQRMNEFGFSNVYIDQVNNVIGSIGEGSPKILLCGHLDTVPGYLKVQVNDKIVKGRGAVDAKSSFAAMLLAAAELNGMEGIGEVIIAAVTDEEGNGIGMKELVSRGINADYAIFGEPSGLSNITIGYKGRISFKIIAKGRGAHAGSPWVGVSAVEPVFKAWEAIKNYSKRHEIENNKYDSLTSCLTMIRGGTSHNIVPENCEAVIDVRVPPRMRCFEVIRDLNIVINELKKELPPDVDITLKVLDMTEPFEADKRSIVVRGLSIAAYEVLGKGATLVKKTGTGDMNVLGNALRIPVVTYGPGNSHLSHTNNEFIEIKEYLQGIQIYKRAVYHINRLHNKMKEHEKLKNQKEKAL